MLQMRNPFGLHLQGALTGNSILPGDQPEYPMPQMPGAPPAGEAPKPQSKFGQILGKLGQLGEVISATQGDEMAMRSILSRQQMAAEDAIWSRRQALQRDQNRADKEWEWAHKPHEPSAMERNLSTWQSWTPEQQAAYRDFNKGDPFVTTTLPNGQFYAGPQSGLIGALTGQVQPSTQPKVGDVVADPRRAGGGAGNSVGGFRP